MNLKEPMVNNTWCPIVTNPSPANILPPVISTQMLLFNPDLTTFPIQNVSFSPFSVTLTCPDVVYYYSSFLSDTSQPLPSFIVFDPIDSVFSFSINQLSNVGMYHIMLQSTIGNNKTTSVAFQVQVYSPCLGLSITVPPLPAIPTYDLSDLVPLLINLNWTVANPPTHYCTPPYFIFTMVNATTGGAVDTSVFSIVTASNGT